jgi:hypothetical protein
MKIRGLIVASVVFFILAGILYWSGHHTSPVDTAKASADTPPAILKLDESTITGLALLKKDEKPIVLAKAESGKWQITAPQAFGADQTVVSGMLSTLSSLNAQRMVEDKGTDLKQYGLDPPALQLEITEKNDKSQTFLIGDDTPTAGAAYAMVAGSPRVFTMATYAKTSVDKSLNDLRDKRLLTLDPEKMSRIELFTKNYDIEFGRNLGRNKDEWQILKPKPLRADSFQVIELARKLTDARMDLSSYDAKGNASVFALATPLATAKVTDESGTQELQVRSTRAGKSQVGKTEGTYYAKSSAVDGIYKINSDLGQALDKGLEDFRNKKLFDFGFVEPNKIELHVGSKAYFLTRSGDDWWSNGKKMDAGNVQSYLSKLRDLAASKFSDSGFANPIIEVTVTSDDGKRVEKVRVAKSKEGYLAERENEPVFYRLNSTSVDELQKAADEMKPAATAGK